MRSFVQEHFSYLLAHDLHGFEVPAQAPPPSPPMENKRTSVAMTKRTIIASLREAYQKRQCPRCWATARCCFCSRIAKTSPQHRITVLCHPNEFLRASNTGHIVARSCPSCARLLIWGIPAHDEALKRLLANPHTLVLFPAEGAELLSERLLRDRSAGGGDQTTTLYNIIGLDGTWKQAKFLRKGIERLLQREKGGARFVRLGTVPSPSLFAPQRKQVRGGGCSTIEALSCAVSTLGEASTARDWLTSLRVMVDALKVQRWGCADAQPYSTFSREEVEAMSRGVCSRREAPF